MVRRTWEIPSELAEGLRKAVAIRGASGERTDASKLVRRYIEAGLAGDGVLLRRRRYRGGGAAPW